MPINMMAQLCKFFWRFKFELLFCRKPDSIPACNPKYKIRKMTMIAMSAVSANSNHIFLDNARKFPSMRHLPVQAWLKFHAAFLSSDLQSATGCALLRP